MDRYYRLLKDTVLTLQPFRLKLQSNCCCLQASINTAAWKAQTTISHNLSGRLFLFTHRTSKKLRRKNITFSKENPFKLKGKAGKKEVTNIWFRVLRQTLCHSVMYSHSSQFQVHCLTSCGITTNQASRSAAPEIFNVNIKSWYFFFFYFNEKLSNTARKHLSRISL